MTWTFAAALLALSTTVSVGAAGAQPLFADSSTVALTIRADLRTLFNDRDSLDRVRHPGELRYRDADGREVAIPAELSTRGHFRRRTSTCSVPPIRVRFQKRAVEGTLFEGQRTLKLVTHCRPRAEYDSYVLEEYLLYRTLNILTDTSFRVRLLRVTWSSTAGGPDEEYWGFFLEHENELERRLNATVIDEPGVMMSFIETDRMNFVSLFEYFIGNTDWSVPGLHNVRILRFGHGAAASYAVVPYDFDWSGAISTRYAYPDYRLPIKRVEERLYRGLCTTPERLERAIARLVGARDAIRALYEASPLAENRRRRVLRYFDDFYRTVGRRGTFERELARDCAREG